MAGKFAPAGHGEGFDAGEDVAIRSLIGGVFQLPSQEQSLFDQKHLERCFSLKSALTHGGSSE